MPSLNDLIEKIDWYHDFLDDTYRFGQEAKKWYAVKELLLKQEPELALQYLKAHCPEDMYIRFKTELELSWK